MLLCHFAYFRGSVVQLRYLSQLIIGTWGLVSSVKEWCLNALWTWPTQENDLHKTGVLESKDVGASSYDKLIFKVFPFGPVVWLFNVCVCDCLTEGGRGRTEVPGGAIRLLWEEQNFQSPHYYRRTFHGNRPREDEELLNKVAGQKQ